MSTAATIRTELRDLYLAESSGIQQAFASTGDGSAAIERRTELVVKILLRLWNELICSGGGDPKDFALVALGGFGRRALFPHSDVDILFLHADRTTEDALREPIRTFCQELWDLRMKLGPTTRTLAECEQFDPQNVEFTISLLNSRHVAGDRELFERLHDKLLPKFFLREGNYIIQQLAEVTRSRHAKYGNTVFHLEPNVKEAPGGLRDYNLAVWMTLLSRLDSERKWPSTESLQQGPGHEKLEPALQFLVTWPLLQRLRRRPLALAIQPRKQRHPHSQVVVAKPAGRLFHIGLEMEHGVSILRMTGTSDLSKLLNDVVAFAQREFWEELVVQSLEQFSIAGNVPAVEKRDGEFDILRIKLLAFRQSARRRPQLHAKVPEFLAERSDRFAQRVFSGAVSVQK